jgi:hypothetical protein
MRFVAGILVGLCLLAFIAGEGARKQAETVVVPNATVDPAVCAPYAVEYVTTHPWPMKGIYAVHCADGAVLTTGGR